jgi:hypothetical protein
MAGAERCVRRILDPDFSAGYDLARDEVTLAGWARSPRLSSYHEDLCDRIVSTAM